MRPSAASTGKRWLASVLIGVLATACSYSESVRDTKRPDICTSHTVDRLAGVPIESNTYTIKCKDVGK